jgi:hypothetical protein
MFVGGADGLGEPVREAVVSQFLGFAKLLRLAKNTDIGWDR